jgi:hypothetical protein
MIDWLETIPNEKLRSDVKKNILVSGGCITSLFQGLPRLRRIHSGHGCSDQTGSALLPRNNYTGVDKVLDGRKREDYLNNIQSFLKLTITNLKKQFATKHLN